MHPMTLDASPYRVVRTFAFLDLCDFTDFVDVNGDADGLAELRLLRSTVRDVAPLCGVRVDKWLGDGVMIVAVESIPAVTAVLAISSRMATVGRLALRAGIASGDVLLLEGDDYVGRTVNLAARLCDYAQPGEVLAALDGLLLPVSIEAAPAPDAVIRGMGQPVRVASLAVSNAGWNALVAGS